MQSTSARAYDLSAYEEVRKPQATIQERPQLTVRTTRKVKKGISVGRLFCCTVLLLTLVSLAIYNNVVTVEMSDQLAQAKVQLETLQDQGATLQTKLDSTASTKAIEEYASSQLGMGKVELYQITYLNTPSVDKIEVTEPTSDSAIVQSALNVYNDLLEYMKLK